MGCCHGNFILTHARFFPLTPSIHHSDTTVFLILPIYTSRNCFSMTEKENAPKTVNDVKLINGGKILENNKTLGECKSPICDISGGITTMHVVVRPPSEKGTGKCYRHPLNYVANIYFVFIISLSFHPYALIHICNCCILNSLMLL